MIQSPMELAGLLHWFLRADPSRDEMGVTEPVEQVHGAINALGRSLDTTAVFFVRTVEGLHCRVTVAVERETPQEHVRNALQILSTIKHHPNNSEDIIGIDRRLNAALDQLEGRVR